MSTFQLFRLGVVVVWLSVSVVYADATAVQRLLTDRCVICHQGDAAPLGLKLESLKDLMVGSNNGPVVIAGEPDKSEILLRIRGVKKPRMPMTGPPWLTTSEETILSDWIAAGANVNSSQLSTDLESNNVGAELPRGSTITPTEDPSEVAHAESPLLDDNQSYLTYLKVAPIFAQRCAKCHAEQGIMGAAPEGYRLTSLEETLAAGERARVIPGNPSASELLRRVRGLSTPRMPLDGPPYLSDIEIGLIGRWIEEGARNSQGQVSSIPVGAKVRIEGILTDKNQIEDANFKTNATTRVDKGPRLGDRVELRARVDDEGGLVAIRLRRR